MNNITYIACKRLEDKKALCYDHMLIKEIKDMSRKEIIEIGVLNITKQNLISILDEISNYVSDVEESIYKGQSSDEHINKTYDSINHLVKILENEK